MQQSQNALGLPIKQSREGQRVLATELYRRFHAMKTYGKEPESLDSIIEVFASDLAEYPVENIMLAIKTHCQRSQEFPTPADIIGLIKRNGRAAITDAQYIAVSKMMGEDRSPADWQLMRDYEAEKRTGWNGAEDPKKETDYRDENIRLRQEIKRLKAQFDCMTMVARERVEVRRLQAESPAVKVENTVVMMQKEGFSQTDIDAFILSQQDYLADAS